MFASRVRTARPGPASVLGPASILLLTSCILAPAFAGDLNGFFKKGGKDSGSPPPSPPSSSTPSTPSSPSSSSDRTSPYSHESGSGASSDLWGKVRRQDSGAQRRSGGLFDLFGKRGQSQPAPQSSATGRPATGLPSATYERTEPRSGGLLDLFRKPGRPQPAPSTSVAPVPAVVVYHYYDPWYYPYDRLFYRYYCPYVIREREIYYGGWPYVYEQPDPEEVAEDQANDALREIERGWREAKYPLIARHIDADGTIAIYHDGEYSHAMTAREFRALTLQAFEDVKTVRFRFFETRMVRRDEAVADGEHLFAGPDGEERTVEVQYTLRKSGRRWYIRSIDLRQEKRVSSLAPATPDQGGPVLSLSSLESDVALDEGVPVARADTGIGWEVERALPAPAGPQVTVEAAASDVSPDENDAALIRVAAADAAPLPAPAAATKPAAPTESSLRVVCEGKAVSLASLRAARKPVRVATVTCLVLKAAPGMNLVPGSRLTCDVRLSASKEGIQWQVVHKGGSRDLESGTIPAAKLKPAEKGHLRVVVDRVTTPMVAANGEQRQPLYSKSRWDYQIAVVASPQKPAAQPARTEVIISRKKG